jgi:hypothetical protein
LLGLHQLGAPQVDTVISESTMDPDAEVRRLGFRIAEAHYADRALPELVRARARAALADSQAVVRVAAGLLLMHAGDRQGEGMVLALVAGQVPEAALEDVQAAITLTGDRGLEAARADLSRRAFSLWRRDPLAYDARVALARLGDERARRQILQDLSAWTLDSRNLAVAAAGRAGLVEAGEQLRRFVGHPELADPAAVDEALLLLGRAEARDTAETNG